MDYNYFVNEHTLRRRPALTRELMYDLLEAKRAFTAPKDSISLAEGMPSEVTFPFESLQVRLKDGSSYTLQGAELNAALQYIPSQGYPPLVETLKKFTQRVNKTVDWDRYELLVTNGSQDGISKAIEMCVEEGDPVLVQNPLYTGAEIVLKPYRAILLGVNYDQHGMSARNLLEVLENWKKTSPTKMPKLLYINPTGSNPTGTTMTAERRKEIYNICCQYNILILEDDAYCFMHFGNIEPPTFLSLDTEGRVIRLDSFSKVVSSGLRLGWITGPKPLIRNIELHIQSSYLHSSTLSQVLTNSLLVNWGFDRLLDHFKFVREYYKARRDCTVASMERHLKGLADWSVPSGGMFVWIKVHGVADVYEMLINRGIKKGITFVPGHAFMADPTQACNCIRASYSRTTPKQIDKAMKMLADLIREEQQIVRRKLQGCI